MANLFKSLDTGGFISTLRDFGLAIRQFFGTKTEMDVVATALTDLDRRIDDAMPTIAVGKVTTIDAGKDADVKNVGTSTKVVLDFYIPRGEQGDMKELEDASDSCVAILQWQSNTNVEFADVVGVPIPTEKAMYSFADCIKQTNKLTLQVGDKKFKTTYDWSELHWSLHCSLYGKVVYTTKYAMPDADFSSVKVAGNVKTPPTTIEITVTSVKGGARYVHVTLENLYGRAYYYVTR